MLTVCWSRTGRWCSFLLCSLMLISWDMLAQGPLVLMKCAPGIALLVLGSIPEQSQKHIGHLDNVLLISALIGFRPAAPIRGDINGVLSEKQVQLGRMFLHVAHGVEL